MQAKLARWGNSLAVRLPAEVVRELGFEEGQVVELTPKKPKLEIELRNEVRRYTSDGIPIYTMAELLADMKPENEPELVDWGPDCGSEIIDDQYPREGITPDEVLNRRAAKGR